MTDAAIAAWLCDELDVTRPELEHVVRCPDCSVTGSSYEPGPDFCHAFEVEFRGWTPPASPPPGSFVSELWASQIKAALARNLAAVDAFVGWRDAAPQGGQDAAPDGAWRPSHP